jgi:poly(A) polymerase
LRCFEDLYRTKIKNDLPVLNYFDEPLAQNRKRLQIIKLACLLHDIGKPRARARKNKRTIFYRHEEIGRKICEKTAMRFKLSSREREVLKNLVFWHLRPGYLADTKIPTARALYRYFRDTATEGVSTALLSLADWRATRGPLTKGNQRKNHEKVMLGLVDHYFAKLNEKPLPKIIDGCDIMKKFNLKPSPLVGMILKTVKEEHALGKVTTKEEAFAAAQRVIKKSGKKYV